MQVWIAARVLALQISVEAGHAIARAVKERMRDQHPEVSKVLIHVEPANAEHLMQRGLSGTDDSEIRHSG